MVYHTDSQQFKADDGKAMPDLLELGFANALRVVQATLEYGANKYEPHSWRKVPDGIDRYLRAGGRHRQDRLLDMLESGNSKILHSRDPESGLPHIAHEIFNLLAIVELALQEEAQDAPDCSAKEIAANLVGCMKKPPTEHKVFAKDALSDARALEAKITFGSTTDNFETGSSK